MAGITLVTGDHGDARPRMSLEPLAPGLLIVVNRRQRHPEPALARRLEGRGPDVRGVRIRWALELGHRLDDQVLSVRDGREQRHPDRRAGALHLLTVGVDERVLRGVVFAHRGDRGAPVLIAELERSLRERALGLPIELLAPSPE